jgi:hypothetical protein
MLQELLREARESGAVTCLFVTPDGAYVKIQVMEELLRDESAGGAFLATEFNHNIAALRAGRV